MSEQQKTINNFFIIVGSNIKPSENIKRGLNLIEQEDSIVIIKQSSEFHSKAVGMVGPDFVNKVVKCSTKMSFNQTRMYLKKIEDHCGRERSSNKFIPRTLDLDVIKWNDFKGVLDGYQLPDPDIEKYDFVSVPLNELLKED